VTKPEAGATKNSTGPTTSLGSAMRPSGMRVSSAARNSLGYDGYSDMQQVFRARLVVAAAPSYRERISAMAVKSDGRSEARPAGRGPVMLETERRNVSRETIQRSVLSIMAAGVAPRSLAPQTSVDGECFT